MSFILLLFAFLNSFSICQEPMTYKVVMGAGTDKTTLSVYQYEDIMKSIQRTYASNMLPLIRYINPKTGEMNSTQLERDLRDLLDASMREIPSECVPHTDFYLLGSGNLRYLKNEYSGKLMNFIRDIMKRNYKLISQTPRFIRILSVEEEAVFQWITVQYSEKDGNYNEYSYGSISLKSSTSSVAFIPVNEQILGHKMSVELFEDVAQIYGDTFLHFGSRDTFFMTLEYLDPGTPGNVSHPCLFLDSSYYSTIQQRHFVGSSDFAGCEELIQNIFVWKRAEECSYPSCTLSNEYLSEIPRNHTFLAYGEFYNIIKGLKLVETPSSSYTDLIPQIVYEKVSHFCDSRNLSWAMSETGFPFPVSYSEVFSQCFVSVLGMSTIRDLLKMNLKSHMFRFINNAPEELLDWEIGAILFENQFEKVTTPTDVTEIYYKVSMIIGFVFFGIAVCINLCLIGTICVICYRYNATKPRAEYVDLQ